jgi:hypothetical protein
MWKKKEARTLRREMTPPFWNSLETTKSISLWSQSLPIFFFAVLVCFEAVAHWHKRLVENKPITVRMAGQMKIRLASLMKS